MRACFCACEIPPAALFAGLRSGVRCSSSAWMGMFVEGGGKCGVGSLEGGDARVAFARLGGIVYVVLRASFDTVLCAFNWMLRFYVSPLYV